MKVEINKRLKSTVVTEDLKTAQGKVITLQDVCIASLLSPSEEDDDKIKWSKYEVYKKIRDAKGGIADLAVEDVSLLKKLIGKNEPPLVMGQSWEMLEGE